MSKVVRLVAGAAIFALGVALGNPFLISIGASVSLGAFAEIVAGGGSAKRQAAVTSLQLGEQPRQAVLGQALVGGTLADGFNYGGKYGTDWEVLVILLADHLCDALVGFYVNDAFVAFSGAGAVPGYNGQLVVTWYPGTADQPADPTLMAHGAWAATDTLAGVSYVVVAYKADASDAKHPVWPSGRPRFAWLVRGKRCYDPRKDSTIAGGSGSHRWSSPATWEWTDNLAVCRYNWARGIYACDRVDQPDQLLVGRGLSAAEAPPERLAIAANLCDEPVALAAGGSEPRYRCAAVVAANEQFSDVEAKFAAACAGVLIQPEGAIDIEPGHAKAVVVSITDADLVVSKPVKFSAFRSQADQAWINSVAAQYVEPKQRWAMHAAPVRRVVADLIADKGPREATPSLEYVSSGTQAQRCAEILRRQGRLGATATITLGPRFNEIEEGDWIVWTSNRRTKGQPVTFRVDAYQDDQAWQKTLQLTQISASCYSWSSSDEIAEGAVAVQQQAPDPAAYGNRQSAYELQDQTLDFPATSDDHSITIAAFSAVVRDGVGLINFPAGRIDNLDSGVSYTLFWTLTDHFDPVTDENGTIILDPDGRSFGTTVPAGQYVAYPTPALEQQLSPDLVYLRKIATLIDGQAPPSETPPPGDGGNGSGGGGAGCPTEDGMVLLANAERTGPGMEIPAGKVRPGMFVWSRHDVTGEWGAWRVTAVSKRMSPIVRAEAGQLPQALANVPVRALRTSPGHRIGWSPWTRMDAIGAPDGEAIVVKITVAGAQTYIVNGVGSHNLKQTQQEV